MSDYFFQFKPGPIEPAIRKLGDNILVYHDFSYNLYRVRYAEGLPRGNTLVFNAGALAAGASALAQSLTAVLDMPEGEILHFRFQVLDDVRITLNQPLRTGVGTLANVVGNFTAFSALYDPCSHLTERGIYWDRRIYVDVVNPTDYAINQSRLAFWGYRYSVDFIEKHDSIEKVLTSGKPFNSLVASGLGAPPPTARV